MFSCNYNGWADVPEEEREGIDAFEAAQAVPPGVRKVALVAAGPLRAPPPPIQLKAA